MNASAIYFFNLFFLFCKRVSKPGSLLRKAQNALLRTSKLIIRPHIIHDQAYNFVFYQKLESFQHNVFLAITGTIPGTSREKLHQALDFESLQLRRWYRGFCFFVRNSNSKSLDYFLILTFNIP